MQENTINLRCSNPVCLGHKMKKIEGLYALTKIEKKQNKLVFHPSTGIPTTCYVCAKCGEIKTFSAKILNEI